MLLLIVLLAFASFWAGWYEGQSSEVKHAAKAAETERLAAEARDLWRLKAIAYLRSRALGCVERQRKALAVLEGRDG